MTDAEPIPTPDPASQPAAEPAADYVTVARVGDITEGRGHAAPVAGRMVAVFLHKGEYHAIDDFCPHMGASLALGGIYKDAVTCPWHAWRFSLCSGEWVDNPKIKVNVYEVRVQGDEIQVKAPATPPLLPGFGKKK